MVTNHVYDNEHNTTEINIDLIATKRPVNSSCVCHCVCVCVCVFRIFNLQEYEANRYINKQYNGLQHDSVDEIIRYKQMVRLVRKLDSKDSDNNILLENSDNIDDGFNSTNNIYDCSEDYDEDHDLDN